MSRSFTLPEQVAPLRLTQIAPASFLLHGPEGGLLAEGVAGTLPQGVLATLAERAADFFAAGGRFLAGAIPYERNGADYLFSPRQVSRLHGLPAAAQTPLLRASLTPEPSPEAFRAAVEGGLARIRAGGLKKLVLSRCLHLHAETPIATGPLLGALARDGSVTQFVTRLPGGGQMIGATPELLIAKSGDMITSHPLAGSARRSTDPAEDEAAGRALLASDKDRREHALAAEAVLDTLSPFCAELPVSHGMALRGTARMWHLGTRIAGRLRDPDTPVAALLAALHPTPAVCGHPRDAAAAAIAELEGYARGFYAGAVGWMNAAGDGEWYVTLRCAEICGQDARLFAGAGVVEGSSPEGEEAETQAKFRTMMDALGLKV